MQFDVLKFDMSLNIYSHEPTDKNGELVPNLLHGNGIIIFYQLIKETMYCKGGVFSM